MNTVQPIKNAAQVRAILEALEADTSPHGRRMYLLFATGIYTGLRISDLVRLRAGNVRGDYIRLKEQKTGKRQSILINKALRAIYNARLKGYADDDFLFPSRKRGPDGEPAPISTRAAAYDMKCIAKRFNINEPFACHSMRKTYGYQLYNGGHGATLEELRQQFNHSKEAVTRRYIGVDEEIRNRHVKKLEFDGYMPSEGGHGTRTGQEGQELETKWR
jgi:integrase